MGSEIGQFAHTHEAVTKILKILDQMCISFLLVYSALIHHRSSPLTDRQLALSAMRIQIISTLSSRALATISTLSLDNSFSDIGRIRTATINLAESSIFKIMRHFIILSHTAVLKYTFSFCHL